jgi:hypothetical protein
MARDFKQSVYYTVHDTSKVSLFCKSSGVVRLACSLAIRKKVNSSEQYKLLEANIDREEETWKKCSG